MSPWASHTLWPRITYPKNEEDALSDYRGHSMAPLRKRRAGPNGIQVGHLVQLWTSVPTVTKSPTLELRSRQCSVQYRQHSPDPVSILNTSSSSPYSPELTPIDPGWTKVLSLPRQPTSWGSQVPSLPIRYTSYLENSATCLWCLHGQAEGSEPGWYLPPSWSPRELLWSQGPDPGH